MSYPRVVLRWLVAAALVVLLGCGQDEAPAPPALGPIEFGPGPEAVQPLPAGGEIAEPPKDPLPGAEGPSPTDGSDGPPGTVRPSPTDRSDGAGDRNAAAAERAGAGERNAAAGERAGAGERNAAAGERAGAGDQAPGPAPAPAGGEPCQDEAPTDGRYTASVAWTNVQSTGGCFFFSGPGRLGRDDQLGTSARVQISGGQATVAFGGARFAGSAGERISLRRVSSHDHGGEWRVTETLAGSWAAGRRNYEHTPCTGGGERTIRARYTYQECDTANPASCPGRCTISADVTIRLR